MTLPHIAERSQDNRVKWAFVGAMASLAAVAGMGSPRLGAAQPIDSLDWRRAPNALDVALDARASGEGAATFRWTMDAEGTDVVCNLDPDGDGDFDYSISDCDGQREVSHTFEEDGVYQATMVAHGRDGRAGMSTIQVIVD